MPSQLTYPGVYIEEIPSGVRTITGVATSITTFIGWTPQGPDTKAERVHSFAEFQRTYGELHADALLGYSVHQFFDNGGGDAYIVRLAFGAKEGKVTLNGMEFTANGPGKWSDFYGISIKLRPPPDDKRFLLQVVKFPKNAAGQPDTGAQSQIAESFENLSMDEKDARYIGEVINEDSDYIKDVIIKPNTAPAASKAKAFAGGDDGKIAEPNDAAFVQAMSKMLDDDDSALGRIDLFNLLCVPGLTDTPALQKLAAYCGKRRAFLIADCEKEAKASTLGANGPKGLTGDGAINAAFYFPWIEAPDVLAENRKSDFPPCGFVAGIYARTDAARGVWKAPAGIEAGVTGALGPKDPLTDKGNGDLNVKGINCIRNLHSYGTVVWGARTLNGDDERGSEWKYIPVRRTALFIEETLYRSLKWVVFEPNDEPLWAQIRLNVGAFMHDLFRQHAFQGAAPREAYFVKCDGETTTQNDINRGVVNILVGFAPLKPAEFVVIKIQQIAGQIET